MNFHARIRPLREDRRSTVTRALVHLPESDQAEPLIQFATELAHQSEVHLRGLTLIETGKLNELVSTCEAAAYAVYELQRLSAGTGRRNAVRTCFSDACLLADLDFDLRAQEGETLTALAQESRFHDLLIAAVSSCSNRMPGVWVPAALVDLLLNGASPVLALNDPDGLPQRVLMIQDGTQPSSNAIRTFLNQGLFPEATYRLLAVSHDEPEAEELLRESVGHIRSRVCHLETGYVRGNPVTVVPEFIHQWEPDLVVLGAQKRSPLLKRLFGETVQRVLQKTNCSLYATC